MNSVTRHLDPNDDPLETIATSVEGALRLAGSFRCKQDHRLSLASALTFFAARLLLRATYALLRKHSRSAHNRESVPDPYIPPWTEAEIDSLRRWSKRAVISGHRATVKIAPDANHMGGT